MTSYKQITDDIPLALQRRVAESSRRLQAMQTWAQEHCLELEELDHAYDRLTANLTQLERERLTEVEITKLLDVAESLMSPAARELLIARHAMTGAAQIPLIDDPPGSPYSAKREHARIAAEERTATASNRRRCELRDVGVGAFVIGIAFGGFLFLWIQSWG